MDPNAAIQWTARFLHPAETERTVVAGLGAIAYLGFDMAVLQGAFVAIDAHPVPTFAVVAMSYLVGGLFGSIPLPANLGAVGGMVGMLTVYGVNGNDATAAVVLYQAIGYIVPLVGGGISYLFLRRRFGEFYAFPPVRMDLAPVQAPHPPLLIGGLSPAALRRAGRFGDGWVSSSRADPALRR